MGDLLADLFTLNPPMTPLKGRVLTHHVDPKITVSLNSILPPRFDYVRGLHELLIGSRFVAIGLGIHGRISGHVNGVMAVDCLSDEIMDGDGAASVRVKSEFHVVPVESAKASGVEHLQFQF